MHLSCFGFMPADYACTLSIYVHFYTGCTKTVLFMWLPRAAYGCFYRLWVNRDLSVNVNVHLKDLSFRLPEPGFLSSPQRSSKSNIIAQKLLVVNPFHCKIIFLSCKLQLEPNWSPLWKLHLWSRRTIKNWKDREHVWPGWNVIASTDAFSQLLLATD